MKCDLLDVCHVIKQFAVVLLFAREFQWYPPLAVIPLISSITTCIKRRKHLYVHAVYIVNLLMIYLSTNYWVNSQLKFLPFQIAFLLAQPIPLAFLQGGRVGGEWVATKWRAKAGVSIIGVFIEKPCLNCQAPLPLDLMSYCILINFTNMTRFAKRCPDLQKDAFHSVIIQKQY